MKMSQVVSIALMAMVLVLGIATEIPHHDHHDDEVHSELGDAVDGHVHFQINGMTALAMRFAPIMLINASGFNHSNIFPSPPHFSLYRPPKTAPVIA